MERSSNVSYGRVGNCLRTHVVGLTKIAFMSTWLCTEIDILYSRNAVQLVKILDVKTPLPSGNSDGLVTSLNRGSGV